MKHALPLLFALCIGIVGASCTKDDGSTIGSKPVNQTELQNLIEIKNDYPEKLAQDNAFAFDLLRTTAKFDVKPNLMLSPLSIPMALNMTLNGAEGETRDEMLSALRTGGHTPEQVNAYSQKLLQALTSVDPNTQLSVANLIWYRKGFPVLAPFIETNRNSYDAAVEEADFAAPATLKRINGWISDHTGGKIENALDNISENAMMYLVNAIYFKSAWLTAFEKSAITDKPFRNSDGSTRSVPTMAQKNNLNYGKDEQASYLELPYANKTFSMVLMLPHEDKTTGDVIGSLTSESWSAVLSGMSECRVDLNLPRFTFRDDYLLNEEILPEMGMQKAFDPEAADFSSLVDFSRLPPESNVYISRVIHKTFIEVAEEGTEAAAVTIVEGDMITSIGPQLARFHADRPFLFAIKENATGTILFLGQVGELGIE